MESQNGLFIGYAAYLEASSGATFGIAMLISSSLVIILSQFLGGSLIVFCGSL